MYPSGLTAVSWCVIVVLFAQVRTQMAYSDLTIHPKITRYCVKRPSSTVLAQLGRFCGRVELVNTYSARHSDFITRIDLYAFKDLRNLFMIDLLLQDIRVYQ